MEQKIDALPNHNYIPTIRSLKEEGKLQEALEIAQFVIENPDMPGQEEAKELAKEIEKKQSSTFWKGARLVKGFITSSGNSTSELIGAVRSDLFIYGDIRDLSKQGYYKLTDEDKFDPFITTLAGIGILTGSVNVAKGVPAVLKVFRKVGALSEKFTNFIITTSKNP